MGVRFIGGGSTAIVNTNIVTTTETVVAIAPPVSVPYDTATVILLWYVLYTTGTSTSGSTLRLRRGTTVTGAQVNVSGNVGQGGGAQAEQSGLYTDQPGSIAQLQYCLTVAQAGATGNGTVLDVCMYVFVL
jgi:hypothetical protein